MTYKLQVKDDGRWKNINQPGFYDISQREAEELEEQYNKVPGREGDWRAVETECPQEPVHEEVEA